MKSIISKVGRIRRDEGWRGVFDRVRPLAMRYFYRAMSFPLQVIGRRDRAKLAAYNDPFYEELGITKKDADRRCEEVSEACGINIPNDSLHRWYFAALQISGFAPRRILEIGTNIGVTTRYLAELFPDAHVTTFDVPDSDPVRQIYHNAEETPAHVRNWQEGMLEKNLDHPRITAIRKNSVWLNEMDLPEFDLIWLDGGHFFPEAAWDHQFSMNNLAPGGYLFSDDVLIASNPDAIPDKPHFDTFKCINYYNQRMRNPFRFLVKRQGQGLPMSHTKFIAYWRKDPADDTWRNCR